jgi:glycosyltransferase involved in cell wall biosynthesis
MRIAMLGPVAPPAGGVQSHISALAARARAAGHQVSFVAITRSEPVTSSDVYYPTGSVDLARILLRLKPDVAHMHVGGELTDRLALLGAALTALPGCASVLTFHSGGFPSSPRGLAASPRSIAGILLRRLDAVVAVNAQIADLFRRYGVADSRLSVIAPYARLDRAAIAPALSADLDAFFRAHSPVFLSVGLLEDEYCLELQIDSIGALRARWPNAGLVMIGSGSLYASLAERIANSAHRDHILLTGNVSHGIVLRAIQEASVLLRTTKFDGDAVSVREALQLGTPVVASDNGMRPDGVTLMNALTIGALAESCAECLTPSVSGATRRIVDNADELDQVLALYERIGKTK